MLAVGFANVCWTIVSSLSCTYSVRFELHHLFYCFKRETFLQKRVVGGWGGGHPSPAHCAKSMVIIPLENNVLFLNSLLTFCPWHLFQALWTNGDCVSDDGLKQALIEKHSLLNYISFFWKLF